MLTKLREWFNTRVKNGEMFNVKKIRAPKQAMSGDQNQFQSRNFFMINTICRI